MKRHLALKSERLAELSTDDLSSVNAAAQAITPDCMTLVPTYQCTGLWPTFNCTTVVTTTN